MQGPIGLDGIKGEPVSIVWAIMLLLFFLFLRRFEDFRVRLFVCLFVCLFVRSVTKNK